MLIFITILMLCAVTTGATVDSAAKKVTVSYVDEFTGANDTKAYKTRVDSVGQFIGQYDINVGSYDKMSASEINALTDGMTLTIRKGVCVNIETADGVSQAAVTMATVGEAIEELGYAQALANDEIQVVNDSSEAVTEGMTIKIQKVTYSDVSFNENIPFEQQTYEDNTVLKGETKIVTHGEYGVRTKTYRVRYLDGVEDFGVITSDEITKNPVTQVTAIGTLEKAVNVKATKGIASGGLASRGVMRYKQKLTMNATAYDTSLGENGGYTRTAIGLKPQLGVVAVDPKVIPLGSRLYIESVDDGGSWVYGYAIAGDTGGAIKGNRIDLCYTTSSMAKAFGRRTANVYILE